MSLRLFNRPRLGHALHTPAGWPPASARLRLRAITHAVAEQILSPEHRDPSWAPGYPAAGDREAASALVIGKPTYLESAPFLTYQIVLRDDDLVIGGAGFHGPPDAQRSVSIGYGVVSEYEGRGYATEALLLLVEVASAHGVRVIKGDTALSNVASQRVMEKAGFRRVRDDDNLRYYERRIR
jgi:RimJ/RimL family protein N-acetyltransferase